MQSSPPTGPAAPPPVRDNAPTGTSRVPPPVTRKIAGRPPGGPSAGRDRHARAASPAARTNEPSCPAGPPPGATYVVDIPDVPSAGGTALGQPVSVGGSQQVQVTSLGCGVYRVESPEGTRTITASGIPGIPASDIAAESGAS